MLYHCKKCNKPLEWVDTFRTSGSIEDGYLQETKAYTCENCNTDYIIEEKATFEKNIQIVYFEEN